MAAPQVAGTAALVLSKFPQYWPAGNRALKVYDILKNSSKDLGEPGWDPLYGWGRINAYNAVLSVSRWDPNNDGIATDALDVVTTIIVAFRNGTPLVPGLTDVNCDGVDANISDVQRMIDIAFRNAYFGEPCFEFEY